MPLSTGDPQPQQPESKSFSGSTVDSISLPECLPDDPLEHLPNHPPECLLDYLREFQSNPEEEYWFEKEDYWDEDDFAENVNSCLIRTELANVTVNRSLGIMCFFGNVNVCTSP